MERPDPKSIPTAPGVYLYRDGKGRVIYVGKARILRRRVLSYFRTEGLAAKTVAMIGHAESVDFMTTTTEKEAFLLEASLIKRYRPHYNILMRDDKQYFLFRCDVAKTFPRLEIVRHARRDGARYFGPFTSSVAARETWKLLHRVFGIRRCTDRGMANRVRPCLYHHMGQCPAPCTGLADKESYGKGITRVCEILSGRAEPILKEMREAMLQASEELEFEKAAVLRDQIRAVEETVERQAAVLPQGGDMDVVGLFPDDAGLALGLVFVRRGAVMEGRSFFWPGLTFEDAPELLWSFIGQFYEDVPPPPRILLPWIPKDVEDEFRDESQAEREGELNAAPEEDLEEMRSCGKEPLSCAAAEAIVPTEAVGCVLPASSSSCTEGYEGHVEVSSEGEREENGTRAVIEQSLSERRGSGVRIVAPQSPQDNRLVDIAQSNAREEAVRRSRTREGADVLALVQKALGLATPPYRIECCDVSHTGGAGTRVGVTCWIDGRPSRPDYRAYRGKDGGDDYATLYEWTARRIESGPPWPDLLLIDGGRGQVASVERGLKDSGSQGLFAIAGIAKARDEHGFADRRAGNTADRIFLPGRSNPLPLRDGGPEILFLQSVRDSAHHFSVASHRKTRETALQSELMRLPGIGTATARLLWDAFGSIEAMRKAGIEGLVAIPGIGRKKAARILERLGAQKG